MIIHQFKVHPWDASCSLGFFVATAVWAHLRGLWAPLVPRQLASTCQDNSQYSQTQKIKLFSSDIKRTSGIRSGHSKKWVDPKTKFNFRQEHSTDKLQRTSPSS